MTAWGANWLEPDRLPVRVLIVGIAASGAALIAVAIADTMGDRDQAPSMSG
jgi:hypothetical protein